MSNFDKYQRESIGEEHQLIVIHQQINLIPNSKACSIQIE
jgi:hypothetical protein